MKIFSQITLSQSFLTGTAVILLLLSIICQIIIGVLYQNMIKQADNMAATTNKLLKQCKLKFSHCYQMNMGNMNVDIFVDKFLNRIRIGKLSLPFLQHLSGQLMLAAVFVFGVCICRGIIDGMTIGALLPYYIMSLFGLYAYFSVSSLTDIGGKRRILKTNLVDYLENHMVNHLNIVCRQESLGESEGEEKIVEDTDTAVAEAVSAKVPEACGFSQKEEDELEQLIREFLA